MILENEMIDVDKESHPEGYTPLMVACFKGFYEIVRLLLDKKANVNKINRLGQKPILFCFSRLEEINFKYENKKICMMLIDLLLIKGADINVRIDDKHGYTVLMKLVSNEITTLDKLKNTIDILKFLIERGADPNIRGFNNKSVYEVVNPNIDNDFYEEIVNTLRNTSQIIFYNNNEDFYYDSNNSSVVTGKNCGSPKKGGGNISGETRIVLEATESRHNCCVICKIIYLNYFSLDYS
jgi:ankyrin repeat protein